MKKPELGRRIQQEIRGMLKVGPLVLASLVLVAMLWRTDSAANSGLFQSSPVQTPPPSLTPPPTATIMPSVTAAVSPQPTAVESPAVTSTAETSTVSPTESVVPAETPTEGSPTETVAPTATPVPTEPPPTDTPAASATSETVEPEGTPVESGRYPEEESNLRFEWGMLFDSVALFFSYVWLCCGILLFIAVPFLFFVLWRASASRQEEDGQEKD